MADPGRYDHAYREKLHKDFEVYEPFEHHQRQTDLPTVFQLGAH